MWVRLDDGFADHPKIVSAGPLAAIIQIRALCYCGRHLTDGFIPAGAVSSLLSGMEHISIASGGVPGLFEVGNEATDVPWTDIMLEQKLWEQVPGGYRVHDYLDYNPSKRDVMQLRRKKAQAGRAGGLAFARARATARDEHAGTEEEGPRIRPAPPKNPPPSPLTLDTLAAALAAREAYRGLDVRGALLRCEQYWLARGKPLTKRAAVNWLNKDAADRVNGSGPVDEYAKFPGARR